MTKSSQDNHHSCSQQRSVIQIPVRSRDQGPGLGLFQGLGSVCLCMWSVWLTSCVLSARRLDVYEEQQEVVGWPARRSPSTRRSVSCRSLSCNRSSVSLNTLAADSDDDELLPSPVQARSSAFSSREVRPRVSASLGPGPWALGPGPRILVGQLLLLYLSRQRRCCQTQSC